MNQAICPKCQATISVPEPEIEIANMLASSVVVLTHPDPVVCACGAKLIPKIQNANLDLAMTAIVEEKPESRIVPATSLLGRAIGGRA